MKSLLTNVLTSALLGRTALGLGNIYNNSNNNRTRNRIPSRANYNQANARRRIRNRNNRTLEINKAIGGTKSVRSNGRNIDQIINFYGRLVFNANQNYRYEFDFDSTGQSQVFDIAANLNDNNEFLTLRKQALQYNVREVAINVNYNRTPHSGDKWAKLVLSPETDKVEETTDPLINRNAMVLDMTSNGNKNYNFKINKLNTDDEHAGWIPGSSDFNCTLKLHVTQAGDNYTEKQIVQQIDQILGEIKVSIRISYQHKDVANVEYNRKNKTKTEKILEINKRLNKIENVLNEIAHKENDPKQQNEINKTNE